MMESRQPTTVVVNRHVIEIRVDRSGSPRSMIVSIELDYARSWSFDEPGWQDPAYGVSDGAAYWWSARHMVLLPIGENQSEPVVITTDEDIRFVFRVAESWLLVCETSVRVFKAGEIASRLDFGETLITASWEGSQLVIGDATGRHSKVSVIDGKLII